jgi:hypothetical protein
MAKKVKSSNLNKAESIYLFGVLFLILFFIISYRRNKSKRREKYEQTNPYVATVDLQERYGGLEKRQVAITDLSTEQLILLKRDGKLNSKTIQHLEQIGKLPSDKPLVSNPVESRPKLESSKEIPVSKPKKRRAKK